MPTKVPWSGPASATGALFVELLTTTVSGALDKPSTSVTMRLAAYTPGRSATNDGREVLAPDNVAELPSGLLVSVHAKIRFSVAVLSSKDPVPSSVTSWPAWID